MKYLLATTNKAKIKRYGTKLKENGIEVITLNDLNIDIDVDETGNSPIENAIIKAKAYNKISNIVTIATQVVQPFGKFKSELNEEERKLATNAEQRKIIDFILNTINTIENFQKIWFNMWRDSIRLNIQKENKVYI